MSVHPIIQRVIQRAYRRGHGTLHLKSVQEVREYYNQRSIKKINLPCEDIPLPTGAFIRIHAPPKSVHSALKKSPLVIYFRPSVYMLGKVEDCDLMCHLLARRLKATVAVIETRLAPEHPFPAPIEDAIEAIQYLYNHHEQLNIDWHKVTLWGESSGGNLAAVISQHLAKEKLDWIGMQILFYPALDFVNTYESKEKYGNGYLLDNTFLTWSLNHYVPVGNFVDERISPLLAEDFKGLPKTILIGAEYDPLHDEQAAYAVKLKKAKVPIETLFVPGMIHGFAWYAMKIREARAAYLYVLNKVF